MTITITIQRLWNSKARLGSCLNHIKPNDKHKKLDKYQIPSATPTETGVFLRFHT
jgi:hypothetical protein